MGTEREDGSRRVQHALKRCINRGINRDVKRAVAQHQAQEKSGFLVGGLAGRVDGVGATGIARCASGAYAASQQNTAGSLSLNAGRCSGDSWRHRATLSLRLKALARVKPTLRLKRVAGVRFSTNALKTAALR